MTSQTMITLIVFLPLIASVIAGFGVETMRPTLAQKLTSLFMVASAVLSGVIFNFVVLEGNAFTVTLLEWFNTGDLQANWALKVDSLTAVMLVVVTWVSAVVHIYSIGYMSHDPHKTRFMSYLSLFTFFMLILVTADNFAQVFVGWEGVGLCSYLLIGFWFKKPEANSAAMKAFIVNRVGDFGFVLGIGAIFLLFGAIDFDTVFATAGDESARTVTFLGESYNALNLICLLIFIGCMGKSAQLLLHVWLPDAMEGPTPVSALIHAATMVTAGVFLVARCSPLFEYAPEALEVVTVVGALTAFFAATVGLVQNDIKRVIAYSTCSQLGYMFFACGVGAYQAAIFHLMTHAFFKALLFLGAGSVIHAMSDEQDMRKMGGIWNKIPYTYTYMWIGSLALAGLPFFAGYYSKDMILEAAYAAHTQVGQFAFWLGIAAAFMTAFYSWRLLFMTFHGKPRVSDEVMSHIHESPKVMLLPLLLLATGALFSGVLGYKAGIVEYGSDFWGNAIFTLPTNQILEHAHHVPVWVLALPIAMGVSGIFFAWVFYIAKPSLPKAFHDAFPQLYQFLLNKWYFDELYEKLFVKPSKQLGDHFWKKWDTLIIDDLGPNGAALASLKTALQTKKLQTGYLYHYAFAMMIGLLLFVSWVVYTQIEMVLP